MYLSLNIAYDTSLVAYYGDLALNSPGVKLPLYIVFGPHIDCKHNLLTRIIQSNLEQPITNPKVMQTLVKVHTASEQNLLAAGRSLYLSRNDIARTRPWMNLSNCTHDCACVVHGIWHGTGASTSGSCFFRMRANILNSHNRLGSCYHRILPHCHGHCPRMSLWSPNSHLVHTKNQKPIRSVKIRWLQTVRFHRLQTCCNKISWLEVDS